MNGLMLAFAFTLPYHVMRAAAAAGLKVHVLGDGASRGLKTSRFCRSYRETRFVGDPEALLAEIGDVVRDHAIDLVIPSDDVATRLLAALRGRVPARCINVPNLDTFDLLNDKGRFTDFCRDNGVSAPQGWLFATVDDLRAALARRDIALPITVKPTNRSGGVGVFHIREPGQLPQVEAIDYAPVLVQRHIRGESVSITALCDDGRITAHVAQQRDAARFRVFADADLLAEISRLVALTRYDGTANFDAIRCDEDGRYYLVECNPRFWYSIYLVMIAGLNFVELSRAPPRSVPATLDGGEFRLSLRQILSRPWRAGRLDWKFIRYCLGDPLPFLLQRVRRYDDSEAAVEATGRSAGGDAGVRPIAPQLVLGQSR
jgi:predicted ATP-grasp superfamily ATP-dependent carboligase